MICFEFYPTRASKRQSAVAFVVGRGYMRTHASLSFYLQHVTKTIFTQRLQRLHIKRIIGAWKRVFLHYGVTERLEKRIIRSRPNQIGLNFEHRSFALFHESSRGNGKVRTSPRFQTEAHPHSQTFESRDTHTHTHTFDSHSRKLPEKAPAQSTQMTHTHTHAFDTRMLCFEISS
jgi:hypothetical protein